MHITNDGDTAAYSAFYKTMDSTSFYLKQRLGKKCSDTIALDSIINTVYNVWNISFDQRDTLFETLLPHIIFKNKKGSCLGVSLILLMLAEEIHCPLYGVVLPGHFFCRYTQNSLNINIEPNKNGFNHPDSYYKERYLSNKMSYYTMSNLTKRNTIGVFLYNAGTIFLNLHDHHAICYLQSACNRIPTIVEVKGNLALAFTQVGMSDSAIRMFGDIFANNPEVPRLALNYGSVAMEFQKYALASSVFQKGHTLYPLDTLLLTGLKQSYVKQYKKDSVAIVNTMLNNIRQHH
jgi:hypothetical protein